MYPSGLYWEHMYKYNNSTQWVDWINKNIELLICTWHISINFVNQLSFKIVSDSGYGGGGGGGGIRSLC